MGLLKITRQEKILSPPFLDAVYLFYEKVFKKFQSKLLRLISRPTVKKKQSIQGKTNRDS